MGRVRSDSRKDKLGFRLILGTRTTSEALLDQAVSALDNVMLDGEIVALN